MVSIPDLCPELRAISLDWGFSFGSIIFFLVHTTKCNKIPRSGCRKYFKKGLGWCERVQGEEGPLHLIIELYFW